MAMTEIPDIYMDLLLEKRAFAHLATVMPAAMCAGCSKSPCSPSRG
jgi:hypothetical protein